MRDLHSASTNFVYAVAGLRVLTNRQIPELEESAYTDGSVRLLFGDCGKVKLNADAVLANSAPSGHWYCLPNEGVTPAYIRSDGKVVLVSECESSSLDCAVQVRRVVPFASTLQGKVILHASAIQYREAVFAFIGASGAGKSTLAKQLNNLGFFILSDDLLPCRMRDGRVLVPLVKKGVGQSDSPLAAIYFLSRDKQLSRLRCNPMTQKMCLQQLVSNGFGELPVAAAWKPQFSLYHRLAQQALAFHLQIPDNISKLLEVTEEMMRNLFPNHRYQMQHSCRVAESTASRFLHLLPSYQSS